MNTKLQELTEKIYLEGVEKGNAEAQSIIEEAQKKANSIISSAQEKAARIIAEAEAKAAELEENTKSELRLYAQQSLNALKTEITNLICGKIVDDSVKAAMVDKNFMQQVILQLAKEWSKKESIVIEAPDAKALTEYFLANAKNLLNQGVTITQADRSKATFTIRPDKGGYKINFGEEELTEYFKDFLRPKLIEMLF